MADPLQPPKTHFIEAKLRGHSGFEMPGDQPHQLDAHGRKLDLGETGRPPIPQIHIEILQDFLRDFLEAERARGRTPKQTSAECIGKVLSWAEARGWKIGSRNAMDRIIRPVYRALWPEG